MTTNIAIVGEAWGAEEERQRLPFVGPSGWELNKMLKEAGINRSECFMTNVFNLRPRPSNDISNLCGLQAQGIPGLKKLGAVGYVLRQFAPEIDRLYDELRSIRPNIVICLGVTAAWAMKAVGGIGSVRGTTFTTCLGFKGLATYHPAAIMREWSNRVITVADLTKAERESHYPEIRRPKREIWIEPTLEDLETFYALHLQPSDLIAVDIETAGTLITCIGFAPNERVSLVIPFYDPRRTGGNYWSTGADESRAWSFVRRVLNLPARKLFQNGLYDIGYLWRTVGLTPRNPAEDTMLLHHSIYPELQKGLGFLGSLYTDEPAWKQMRKTEMLKKDE
jgi:uracil-DNA glycosylase